jgi:hypothetical protein
MITTRVKGGKLATTAADILHLKNTGSRFHCHPGAD